MNCNEQGRLNEKIPRSEKKSASERARFEHLPSGNWRNKKPERSSLISPVG
jgi:hypothetical protein